MIIHVLNKYMELGAVLFCYIEVVQHKKVFKKSHYHTYSYDYSLSLFCCHLEENKKRKTKKTTTTNNSVWKHYVSNALIVF